MTIRQIRGEVKDELGVTRVAVTDLRINLRNVHYVDGTTVVGFSKGPIVTSAVFTDEQLYEGGLLPFTKSGGGTVWANPSKVEFYYSSGRDTVLVFPNDNELTVDATTSEIERNIG